MNFLFFKGKGGCAVDQISHWWFALDTLTIAMKNGETLIIPLDRSVEEAAEAMVRALREARGLGDNPQ